VGTPIGNLGDITMRAVRVLGEVHQIAAEDTRRTRALLSHLNIRGKALMSLGGSSAHQVVRRICADLGAGRNVALVTDGGMPAVSDPGAELVRQAAAQGTAVVSVPGPSAVTAAVALSGLVTGPFLFLGFLPRSGARRRHALARIAASREPVVLFESPVRVQNTLSELATRMPDRPASISRELTKLHEQTQRGSLADLERLQQVWRGEVTLVIAPSLDPEVRQAEKNHSDHGSTAGSPLADGPPSDAEIDARILQSRQQGVSTSELAKELARWSGRPRREIYARAHKLGRG
jgi:16S rRNA (cytidine1402-2'-O)-methyltransferase